VDWSSFNFASCDIISIQCGERRLYQKEDCIKRLLSELHESPICMVAQHATFLRSEDKEYRKDSLFFFAKLANYKERNYNLCQVLFHFILCLNIRLRSLTSKKKMSQTRRQTATTSKFTGFTKERLFTT
jgi:hypothetical protein